MKKIVLFLVVFWVVELHAQELSSSDLIIRSTLSVSSIQPNEQNEILHLQCIGQASVIGSFQSGEYILSQGFIQPEVWKKIVNPDDVFDLKVNISPNPFIDFVSVSFLETTNQPIEVTVFDVEGSTIIPVRSYDASQKLNVNLEVLVPGSYYIKIVMQNKKIVDRLIKLE